MSPLEIPSRGLRHFRYGAERLGMFRADHPPEPDAAGPRDALRFSLPTLENPASIIKAADDVMGGRFEFFGQEFQLGASPSWNTDPKTGVEAPLAFGKSLDYRDPRVVGDIKYLWELNRHIELVLLAQAYRLTGKPSYLTALRGFLASWIEQCPYLKGPNWCSSLELGIRLINWHFAYCISGGAESPMFAGKDGERFHADWLRAIYQHTHFIMGHLSTYASSANNHLIGELAGVLVSASTWPRWPEMEAWRVKAHRLLCREVDRQTYPDGVNKEQAIWYQQFVLFFLIVAGLVGERVARPFPESYWERVASLIGFISSMMDVGGNLPMIGDADDGIVFALEPRSAFDPFKSLLAVGAVLFENARWAEQSGAHEDTARWLCGEEGRVASPPVPAGDRNYFPAGGYYLLGSRLGEPDEARVLVDAGPLGYGGIAAHGHADCLALTLSVAGREILIDPGTYAYHSDHDWRDYFRGTGAHNTVRIDGRDQSEIGGPFMWLKKAEATVEAFESSDTSDYIRARHSGYQRFSDPVIHIREVTFDKRALTVQIVDRIECGASHVVERLWHFSEDCDVRLSGSSVTATHSGVSVLLECEDAAAEPVILRGSSSPIAGWVSRSFGQKTPAPVVNYRNSVSEPVILTTTIKIRSRSVNRRD